MADYNSVQSPPENYSKPSSSFFGSPRLFTGFTSKGFTDIESNTSPTSILDGKPFSALKTPFWSDNTAKSPKPKTKAHWDKLDSRGFGLVLVDALIDEKPDSKLSKPSRMVLFGSQLKIQIPPLPPSVISPADSPVSPSDFGIKTKKSPFGCSSSGQENTNSPRVFNGCISASEMELSEDYTCVISRGPNPKTTRIFDDCIVESCCGVAGFVGPRKGHGFSAANQSTSYPSERFLSFCYSCKKNLGEGGDIFMYSARENGGSAQRGGKRGQVEHRPRPTKTRGSKIFEPM